MGQPLRKSATIFTYADYFRWPDDERWELIDGVAYAMAAPGLAHQTALFISPAKAQRSAG
jgi:Uma2 family endonuclease